MKTTNRNLMMSSRATSIVLVALCLGAVLTSSLHTAQAMRCAAGVPGVYRYECEGTFCLIGIFPTAGGLALGCGAADEWGKWGS